MADQNPIQKKKWHTITTHVADADIIPLAIEQSEKRGTFDKLQDEIAVEHNELAKVKAATKERVEELQSKAGTLDRDISRISRAIVTRELERDIEVIETFDDARCLVLISKADDPRHQPFRTRPMNEAELKGRQARMQGSLFDLPDNAPADASDDTDSEDQRDTDVPPPPVEAEGGGGPEEPEVQLDGQPLVSARKGRGRRLPIVEAP